MGTEVNFTVFRNVQTGAAIELVDDVDIRGLAGSLWPICVGRTRLVDVFKPQLRLRSAVVMQFAGGISEPPASQSACTDAGFFRMLSSDIYGTCRRVSASMCKKRLFGVSPGALLNT